MMCHVCETYLYFGHWAFWGVIVFGLFGLASLLYIRALRRRYGVAEFKLNFIGFGHVIIRPNAEDLQVAHRIWVELVTRKAAIPFDEENDVIVEVYDSWYTLFKRTRDLISDVNASSIYRHKSTRDLVDIAVKVLNLGLRPHLTKWQARFRFWWKENVDNNKGVAPQDLQKKFPEYDQLVADLKRVNQGLSDYAGALENLVSGSSRRAAQDAPSRDGNNTT